jgi:hypothetical protein
VGDLPGFGNVNTVRQDPKNPTLLYVGTEFGFFASGDEGTSWVRFMPNLPVTRVDDVVVHPRDGDLVLASHGYSVWIMDDITSLQEMRMETLSEPLHLFAPREAVLWANDVQKGRYVAGDRVWQGENAPAGTAIDFYVGDVGAGEATVVISDLVTGEAFRTLKADALRGMNRIQWDLRGEQPERDEGGGGGGFGRNRAPSAEPGVYRVTLTLNGQTRTATVRVLADEWLDQR